MTYKTRFYQIPKLLFQNPIWFRKLFKACTKMQTIENFQRPITVQIGLLFNVIIRLYGTLKSMPVKRLKSNSSNCDGSMCPTKSDLSDARYVRQNSQICPTRPDMSHQRARCVRQIQICPTE